MARLIDADALLARYDAEHQGAAGNARRLIEEAPTLSPDEVRDVGEWVDKGVRAWSCSCCGTPLNHIRQFSSFEKNELPNYCPNCGARMEGTSDA